MRGLSDEGFNFDDLLTFIQNRVDTSFGLSFAVNISQELKNQLDILIDTIIASKIPNRYIWYFGQDNEKKKIMSERYK
uniref:Uncharacterized protein n=1 Tax=Panagrolaimus sp. ES5 TaxID=591445 RepID=A0AC34G8I2_9BILA